MHVYALCTFCGYNIVLSKRYMTCIFVDVLCTQQTPLRFQAFAQFECIAVAAAQDHTVMLTKRYNPPTQCILMYNLPVAHLGINQKSQYSMIQAGKLMVSQHINSCLPSQSPLNDRIIIEDSLSYCLMRAHF